MEKVTENSLPTGWGYNVKESIVKLITARHFDIDGRARGTFSATGCIVDHRRGLILTSRHHLGEGPFFSHAILANREQVSLVSNLGK